MKTQMLFIGVLSTIVLFDRAEAEVELSDFDAEIYGHTNTLELQRKNPLLGVGLTILQYSYRSHLDEVCAKKHPDLLDDNSYKYFLSIYKVIFEEIAKMKLDIKVMGDSVYYAEKQEIIECTSEKNFYKSIELYDESNWIYLLLINVLYQVKNSNANIDERLIRETASKIKQAGKYVEYAEALERAEFDIVQYFEQLDLYKYLKAVREFKLDELLSKLASLKDEEKQSTRYSFNYNFNNLNIEISKYYSELRVSMISKIDSSDIQQFTIPIFAEKHENDKVMPEIWIKNWDYSLNELKPNENSITITKHERNWWTPQKEITFPDLNSKAGYTIKEFFCSEQTNDTWKNDNYIGEAKPVVDWLLEEATKRELDVQERIFLEHYFALTYHKLFAPNYYNDVAECIHFCPNENVMNELKILLERIESQLREVTNKIAKNELISAMDSIIDEVWKRYDTTFPEDNEPGCNLQ